MNKEESKLYKLLYTFMYEGIMFHTSVCIKQLRGPDALIS